MGTISGATIECNVGDTVVVHFRNKDSRTHSQDGSKPITADKLVHSLHTHGFVFAQEFDGAYPLSRLDEKQPINMGETAIWAKVPGGIDQFRKKGTNSVFKRGDRVPPGGTFDYTWQTLSWPTTAGVWIYHDHSIADTENVGLGAIGFVVIHDPSDPNDVTVTTADLPGGSFTGSPIPNPDQDPNGQAVVEPPTQAQYLTLFHTFGGVTCMNGRQWLGNTPTLIAGLKTKMRFGIAGMGNSTDGFHTFHIHGHRWVIPGPDGNKNAGGGGIGDPSSIQNSAMVRAVSQFEDTKVFGPANSFVFTIHEDAGQGSFMRAEPALGEWHMHCHVLDHMMQGMMGSLLVVEKGQVLDLPQGVATQEMIEMRLRLQQRMRQLHPM
jgi:FtsP/CotA-like multicopper oxidase with cupredoxin domain